MKNIKLITILALSSAVLFGGKATAHKAKVNISNRKEAIKTACSMANANDIILVAGKGHEKYQEIKGVKTSFDDKEVLTEIFKILDR